MNKCLSYTLRLMGTINTPIGDKPPEDPYEKYRVQASQRDAAAKEPPPKEPNLPPEKTPFVLASLYTLLRKVVQLFEEKTARGVPERVETEVREHLLAFRASFKTLRAEDRSQDVVFLNGLSTQWHFLLEDLLRFRRTSPFLTAFRGFVRELQSYPPDEQHTFGYYLSEYAGQSWLPFPYLSLIHRLHQEGTVLDGWVVQIDNLVGLLSGN